LRQKYYAFEKVQLKEVITINDDLCVCRVDVKAKVAALFAQING